MGKRHLEEAMRAFSGDVHFEVMWKPFFLNRNTPEAGIPLLDYMEKKFGPQAKKMALEGSGPLSQAGRAVVSCMLMLYCMHHWERVMRIWTTSNQSLQLLSLGNQSHHNKTDQSNPMIKGINGITCRQTKKQGVSRNLRP